MTSQSIKEAARRFGADLVGIADAELLRDLPADENPLSIFPQAKAVSPSLPTRCASFPSGPRFRRKKFRA